MDPHQGGLWAFMRRREALMTSPGPSTAADGSGLDHDDVAWQRQEALPPAQLPPTWDPQAHWLQASPSTPAPAHAAIATAPYYLTATDAPASETPGSSSKPRGFAAVWSKLKATFSRSSNRGRRRGARSGTSELCGGSAVGTPASQPVAAPSSSTPPAQVWHATSSDAAVPPPPPERQLQPSWPMQYNVPAGSTRDAAPPKGRASSRLSLPGEVPFAGSRSRHSMAEGSFPAAPHAPLRRQQQQQESCTAVHNGSAAMSASLAAWGAGSTQLPGFAPERAAPPAQPVQAADNTVRRLVFSPPAAGAAAGTGTSRGQQLASHPIPISDSLDRCRHPAADWRSSRELQQQQQPAPWPPARRQPAQSFDEWRRSMCLPTAAAASGGGDRFVTPRLSTDVLSEYQYRNSGAGRGPPAAAAAGSLPPALAELLVVPGALAGRWLRDDTCGPEAGGTADVHALLQMPQLQAAVWDQTHELQISESEGQLELQWTTQLGNGSSIRLPPETYPKSGALATVPRLDGRGGSAAAQLAASVDGSVCIKALQGPPLPAVIHRKLTLSASGGRLRTSLKVRLLEEGEGRRRSTVGGRAAKQVNYWRRDTAC